ncbi:MAG: hypothetical protein ACOCZS_02680 [Verrucomicrobiota bacterium]
MAIILTESHTSPAIGQTEIAVFTAKLDTGGMLIDYRQSFDFVVFAFAFLVAG